VYAYRGTLVSASVARAFGMRSEPLASILGAARDRVAPGSRKEGS
jgi:hypothetical protein